MSNVYKEGTNSPAPGERGSEVTAMDGRNKATSGHWNVEQKSGKEKSKLHYYNSNSLGYDKGADF